MSITISYNFTKALWKQHIHSVAMWEMKLGLLLKA